MAEFLEGTFLVLESRMTGAKIMASQDQPCHHTCRPLPNLIFRALMEWQVSQLVDLNLELLVRSTGIAKEGEYHNIQPAGKGSQALRATSKAT